ncbi:hypothetical protein [Brazilian marseillevirus]|uniref:hypothetical protein n=1 Tax=Brazilian marseillevirus TaxID=1813599 RepID=UPI0007812203|nr:hypothetical protein A3303_gp189 [Brazilian marseillevirus]AMQ10697.1 hypothetical protein [Brazilian marseillevirus]
MEDFCWRKNAAIHRGWEERGSGDIEELSNALSVAQYDMFVKDAKLVWFPVKGGKRLPILLVRGMNLEKLERGVFCQIWNNHCVSREDEAWFTSRVRLYDTKSKALGTTHLTQKNFWKNLEQNRVLRPDASRNIHCLCSCLFRNKF